MRLGRKRGPVYDHFILSAERGATKRFKCKHCGKETSQNRKRMESHLNDCPSLSVNNTSVVVPGRKRGAIYEHFTLSSESVKGKRFKCVYCAKETSQNKSRMEHHLVAECIAASQDIKNAFLDCEKEEPDQEMFNQEEYMSYCNNLALAIITENAPWSLLDNPYFQAATHILQPSLVPLTHLEARNSVLPRLECLQNTEIQSFAASAQYLTFVVANDARVLVVNELSTSFLLAQAQDFSTLVQDFINHYKPPARLSVCSSLGPLSLPCFTLQGTCMSLVSQLLVKDLLTSIPMVLKALESAYERIEQFHAAPSLMQTLSTELGTEVPVSQPCKRWTSYGLALKQLVRLNQFTSPEIIDFVQESSEEWQVVDGIVSPIHFMVALSALQGISSGQLLCVWIWALATIVQAPSISEENKASFQAAFLKRLQHSSQPHWLAALVLDPRVHATGLSPAGKRVAESTILDLATSLFPELDKVAFLASLSNYMEKSGEFSQEINWEGFYVQSPHLFWKRFEDYRELSTVAKLVISWTPVTACMDFPMSHSIDNDLARLKHTHCRRPDNKTILTQQFAALIDTDNTLDLVQLYSSSSKGLDTVEDVGIMDALKRLPDIDGDASWANLSISCFDTSCPSKIRATISSFLQ